MTDAAGEVGLNRGGGANVSEEDRRRELQRSEECREVKGHVEEEEVMKVEMIIEPQTLHHKDQKTARHLFGEDAGRGRSLHSLPVTAGKQEVNGIGKFRVGVAEPKSRRPAAAQEEQQVFQ